MNNELLTMNLSGNAWYNEFPGDYTDGETPVPIPNTEAKPVRPMVVRKGESRWLPGIYEGRFRKEPAFFVSRIAYVG